MTNLRVSYLAKLKSKKQRKYWKVDSIFFRLRNFLRCWLILQNFSLKKSVCSQVLKRFHGWWSANGQTNWFVVLCTLTLTPTPKPTKNSSDQTSFPQDFQLLLPQIHQKRRYLLSFLTGNWFSDKLFSSVSHEFGHRAAQQVGLLFQKNQSKIWFNKGMIIRINYGTTFWDVFSFRN